jgi:hypothetical protein
MRRSHLLTLAFATAIAAPSQAALTLFASGTITGSSAGTGLDLSGLTGALENGNPAAMLGGLGSGLTYAGGNTFLAVPDRGPNAAVYNPAIDNTVSYISRVQTLSLGLTPGGGTLYGTSTALPFTLSTELTGTTLLSSSTPLVYGNGAAYGVPNGAAVNTPGKYYFTGRSDNFDPSQNSGNPLNARLDPESIRVSNDGKTVFISDEYGPYVRQFDRATGTLVRTFTLPADLDVATQGTTTGAETPPNNNSGRVANKGMESLAITPDGKTLVGVMQAPLIQDASDPATASMVRIVTIDIATGTTKEYGYNLTTGSGVSDIVAINDHQFLVDERDGKGLGDGSKAKVKQIFKIDIAGAQDITGKVGAATASGLVQKTGTFLDLVSALTAAGLKADQIPAKIEGISFGQDVMYGGVLYHTLYIANDNDFLPGTSGPNQFYVFGFQDGDLPGYVAQQFGAVPEPASWIMMIGGFGAIGGALRRRKRTQVTFA